MNSHHAIIALLLLLPLTTAFSFDSISVPQECQKQWPCGFILDYSNASASDYGKNIQIMVLEDGYPIQELFSSRYESKSLPLFGATRTTPYTLSHQPNGTIQGSFTPGHFMQSQRNYTIQATYGSHQTNNSFYLDVYRQPDVFGDSFIWLINSIPYFIGLLIVLFILYLIFSAVWRR